MNGKRTLGEFKMNVNHGLSMHRSSIMQRGISRYEIAPNLMRSEVFTPRRVAVFDAL